MPHKTTLPPLPAAILTPYQTRRRLERANAARRFAESGGLRQHSANPDDDALLALQAALQSGADPQQIQELLGQSEVAQKTGFKERFMGALRAAGLPFEAFSEGVNALVGPLVPQQKFQERSTQSRQILKSMFGGDLSVAEAAGALRDVYEQRSGWEQLITGVVFDPLNVLIPGVSGVRAGLKVGAATGAKFSASAAARQTARSSLQYTLPVGGGKLAESMGLRSLKRVLTDITNTHDPEWLAWQRRKARPAAGASDDEPFLPAVPELGNDRLEISRMQWFYDDLKDPDYVAGVGPLDELIKYYRAGATSPARTALTHLGIETWGRSYEIGNLRVRDIDFAGGFAKFRSAGRKVGRLRSVPISDETLDLLRDLTAGRAPDAPVFTKADILHTTGKPGELALGSTGLNAFVVNTARAAGIQAATEKDVAKSVRVMSASAWAGAALLGGASPSTIQSILGHEGYQVWATYARGIGKTMHQDVAVLAEFLRGTGSDIEYSGLKTARGTRAVRRVEALTVQAGELRAEIAQVPELKGITIPLRKGAGGTKPILGERASNMGVARLEALPYSAKTWDKRFAALTQELDRKVLSVAMRAAEGEIVVHKLEVVRDYVDVMMGQYAKNSAERTAWARVGRRVNTDIKLLVSGLDEYNQQLSPHRNDLRRILGTLTSQGLMDEEAAQLFDRGLDGIAGLVRSKAEAAKRYYAGGHRITKATLAKKGLSYEELREKPGLTGLELAPDGPTARSRVLEWLSNEKVREVLSTFNIEVSVVNGAPVISESTSALRTKLMRMGAVGGSAAHLLGNDLHTSPGASLPTHLRGITAKISETFEGGIPRTTGPDEVARARRVDAIMQALPPESLVELEKARLQKARLMDESIQIPELTGEEIEAVFSDAPRSAARQGTPLYEAPRIPRDLGVEAQVKSLPINESPMSVEKSLREDIFGNPVVSRWVDKLDRNIAEDKFPIWSKIGRNLLLTATLPGAAYGKAPSVVKEAGIEVPRRAMGSYVAAWRQNALAAEALRDLTRSVVIRDMPGYKTLMLDKAVDIRTRIPWASASLEMADNFMSRPEWMTLVEKFKNYRVTAHSGLQMKIPEALLGLSDAEKLAYNALHNYAVIFGSLPAYGTRTIPFEDLPKLYKLSREELEFIKLVQEMPRTTTRTAIGKIGKAKMLEFLGESPRLDWVPRVAAQTGKKRLEKPPLAGRPLGEPGIWAKEPKLRDAVDAWEQGVLYESPFESVLDYMADMRRVAADQELINLLKRDNFFEVGRKRWDTQESAGRTLLGLAQAIKAGNLPRESAENVSRLLNYASPSIMKDELTRHMGMLAVDIMTKPERIDELMPKVLARVGEAEESVKSATELRSLTKGLPGLGKMWFSEDVQAQRAIKFFEEQNKGFMGFLGRANQISSAMRMMQAGVDVSFLFIQGMTLLPFGVTRGFEGTRIWARSAQAAFSVWKDPAFFEAYVSKSDNVEAIKSLVANTGVWNMPHELFEATTGVSRAYEAVGSFVTGPLGYGKPALGAHLKNVPAAFERMFTTYLLHARLELWKALLPMAGTDTTKLHELARFVNKMTGVYNPATSGVTQFQRHMEGTFLSFAPMYRRAAYGLLVDAFRGAPGTDRLGAKLAQEAMVSLAVAGMAIAVLAKESGNNPEALDFGSAKFMSFRVSRDSYIGIGSAYYSLVRATYAVTEQLLDPDRRGDILRPTNWFNVRDNQLARWWRSQAPPIPQLGIDLVLGQTYIGEPLRGEDGGLLASALGAWGLGQVTPMAIESIVNEVRGVADAPIVLGESFGMRTFPVSKRDELRNLQNNTLLLSTDPDVVAWRKEQEAAGQPVVFASAPALLRTRIDNTSQGIKDLRAEVEKDTLLRGTSELQQRTLYFQQIQKNKDFIKGRLQSAVLAFQGTHDTEEFRQTIKEARAAASALSITTGKRFDEVTKWLDELKDTRASAASSFLGDLIYDRYYSNVVLNPNVVDENGNFLPSVYERTLSDFIIQHGIEWWDYVQKRRKEARQYPDLVEDYLSAVEDLQPYWKLHYTIWGEYSQEATLIDQYLSLPPRDKPLMADGNLRLRRSLTTLSRQREKFRSQNPELDWLLTKWYGYTPATSLSRERLVEWEAQRR